MTTLWSTYEDERRARRAVEGLLDAGVPPDDVRLLIGSRSHDVREEPVGEFGGVAEPEDPVGTFGNVQRLRRQGAGSFAGDPDRLPQRSFAEADRDVVVTYDRNHARSHIVGDHGLRQLLQEAALDDAAIDFIVAALHAGHAVVLAHGVADTLELPPAA